MMVSESIGKWIWSIAASAVFCSIVLELSPGGQVKNVLKALCGMLMAIALISPLLRLSLPEYSINLAKYRALGEEMVKAGQEEKDFLSRSIIEEECRAYILDKGRELGLEIRDAKVTVKWNGEGFWYPVECEIYAEYSPRLVEIIAGELGIREESQKWTEYEE